MKTLASIYDNTARIKQERSENEFAIGLYEKHVPKRKPFAYNHLRVGQKAFHLYGKQSLTIEAVEGFNALAGGRWWRAEEWQHKPWTAEDRAAYDAHCMEQSRIEEEASERVREALFERRKLRREFIGR